MLIDEFQAKLHKTDSYITCISLLDDLLNHCDCLIKSNDNNEECKSVGIDFNPFHGNIFEYFGVLFGSIVSVFTLIYLIITYLP